MRRLRSRSAARAGGLLALLLCAGCLGPSNATGRLYQWNAGFENKWGREGLFLLLLPVYSLTSFGDNLIFNSIYWWTGDNPIDPPSESAGEYGF